jgi:hypothetical protein
MPLNHAGGRPGVRWDKHSRQKCAGRSPGGSRRGAGGTGGPARRCLLPWGRTALAHLLARFGFCRPERLAAAARTKRGIPPHAA